MKFTRAVEEKRTKILFSVSNLVIKSTSHRKAETSSEYSLWKSIIFPLGWLPPFVWLSKLTCPIKKKVSKPCLNQIWDLERISFQHPTFPDPRSSQLPWTDAVVKDLFARRPIEGSCTLQSAGKNLNRINYTTFPLSTTIKWGLERATLLFWSQSCVLKMNSFSLNLALVVGADQISSRSLTYCPSLHHAAPNSSQWLHRQPHLSFVGFFPLFFPDRKSMTNISQSLSFKG